MYICVAPTKLVWSRGRNALASFVMLRVLMSFLCCALEGARVFSLRLAAASSQNLLY